MIRPKGINNFIDKVREDFPQFQSIFVTNLNGTLVACSPNNPQGHNLYSTLSLAWDDFVEIGRVRFMGEDYAGKGTLKNQIVELDKQVIILTSLGDQNSDIFILGIGIADRKQLGLALQKLSVVKSHMEKEMEAIIFNKG